MWQDSALTLVLLSLCFNGCNDVIFKKYALKLRSKGMMIAGAGAVWALWQFSYLQLFSNGISVDEITLKSGLVGGIILVLANILFIESMAQLDISLASTLYRLNTIGVVILSFVFLNEPLGAAKLFAISLGILSVYLLYQPSKSKTDHHLYFIFLLVVILGSALRASYGVYSKIAIIEGANIQGMIFYTALCWVLGGLLYAYLKEKRLQLTYKTVVYMLISGSLIFLTVATLLEAISLDEVSKIIPIANLSFVIALLISSLLNLEPVTKRKLWAILIAVTSILMLSRV